MRWSKPFAAAALLAAIGACADAPTGPGAPEVGPVTRPAFAMNAGSSRVVGYFPTWTGAVGAIRYDKLTHINYAFVDVQSNGSLTGVAMDNDARLDSLVQQAHTAGVKVLISVGGWNDGDDSGFAQMAASSTARAAFVSNLVTFVGNYGLDGVDIDWEYPNANTSEATDYATLMSVLDTAMHSRGKLLTAAVAATSWYGNGIASSVFGNVDYLVLMAYDDDYPHSTYAYASGSLDYWLGRGLPASKAVLGVPFYGRDSGDGYKSYREIVRGDAQAPTKDTSNGFYYNGPATIKQKTTLALQRGSGVGIWELTQDTVVAGAGLLDAIHEAMNAEKVVYDDAVAGWANWSWDVTVNTAATSPVYLGSSSMAVTFTAAWGGVYLRHGSGISPSGLTKLEFYVHGGTAGGQEIMVYLGDTVQWLPMVPLNDYVQGGSVAAGAWRKVSIPLSALGVSTNPILKLVLHDDAGGPQPTFYVDQIRFVP